MPTLTRGSKLLKNIPTTTFTWVCKRQEMSENNMCLRVGASEYVLVGQGRNEGRMLMLKEPGGEEVLGEAVKDSF